MKHTPVEVEVMVPCAEGREHPVRLRIHSWNKWELAYTPCEELLGRGFALMVPCAAYVHDRSYALKMDVLKSLLENDSVDILLEEPIEDDDFWNSGIMFSVCHALGQTGDPRALNLLLDALNSVTDGYEFAGAAVEICRAIEQTGSLGIKRISNMLEDVDHFGDFEFVLISEILASTEDSSAIPALIRAYGSNDRVFEGTYKVWEVAADALGRFVREPQQEKEIISLLLKNLESEIDYPARALLRFIRDYSSIQHIREEAMPMVVQAFIELLEGDEADDVRSAAAWALGEIGDAVAVPALIQALEDWDEDVRRAAAEALGELGDAQAVPALSQALNDSDEDVRAAAQEALNQIRARQQAQTEGDRQ